MAIGVDLAANQVRLFTCDAAWNATAITIHESVDAAKAHAADAHPGVDWQAADIDIAALLADAEAPADLACSFCGRPAADVAKLVTGPDGAAICNLCVRELHRQLHEKSPPVM